jgi:hypothetical protein
LDVPNGCEKCKYDDINVHDVVMSKIPWLHTVVVVDGNNLPYGSLILKPTLNPTTPQTAICDIDDGQKHPIIHRDASKLTP